MINFKRLPLTVNITLLLVLVNILFWLGYGIIIAFDLHPALPDAAGMRGFMVAASIVNAGVLLGLFVFLRRKIRLAYYGAIAFFILMFLLTIFDEVGWVDMVVAAINIIPVILLILDRKWYLSK